MLERTLCYGTCPAYRLRLSSTGRAQFRSRNPNDLGRVHSDTLPSGGFYFLMEMAEQIGFFELPDRIDGADSTWCPDHATDHPTYIGTIYSGSWRKRVVYYTGCYTGVGEHTVAESLGRLRQFFSAIDSVAGSDRWVRPGRTLP